MARSVPRKSRQLFGPGIRYSNQNLKNQNAASFLLLTDSFDHIICKNIETSILDLNKSSFSALLIIGTFKKRYPLDV